MGKVDDSRDGLRRLDSWEGYLREKSGLPGPRGNIELAQAVAAEGSAADFKRWAALDADRAPTGTADEFLAFCGVLGHGRLLAEGRRGALRLLRRAASDPRWRVREAVAMALQRFGEDHMDALLSEMDRWSMGNPMERRAVAAALCEPRLLVRPSVARRVLRLLDRITSSILEEEDRRAEGFRVLRKGLGYAWSVAVAASPADGKARMEKWFACDDPDVRWIMRENLRKNRLVRVDPSWASRWVKRLARP